MQIISVVGLLRVPHFGHRHRSTSHHRPLHLIPSRSTPSEQQPWLWSLLSILQWQAPYLCAIFRMTTELTASNTASQAARSGPQLLRHRPKARTPIQASKRERHHSGRRERDQGSIPALRRCTRGLPRREGRRDSARRRAQSNGVCPSL